MPPPIVTSEDEVSIPKPRTLILPVILATTLLGASRSLSLGLTVIESPASVVADLFAEFLLYLTLACLAWAAFWLVWIGVNRSSPGGIATEAALDPESVSRREAISEVRRGLQARDWPAVREGLVALEGIDSPEVETIRTSWDRVRQREVARLDAQGQASREARDLIGILSAREALIELDPELDRSESDREVAPWVIRAIQKRLIGGSVDQALVDVAKRASHVFAHTPEGASLKASVPTLEQSLRIRQSVASLDQEDPDDEEPALPVTRPERSDGSSPANSSINPDGS